MVTVTQADKEQFYHDEAQALTAEYLIDCEGEDIEVQSA